MNKQVKTEHLHYVFMGAVVFIIVLCGIIGSVPDNDSWFIINTGKYIVENKLVPTTNVWTIHSNFDIIIQQWLSSVINYLIYNNFGSKGLITLTLIIVICINIVIINYNKLYTSNRKVIFICVALSNIIMLPFYNNRPQLFSILILTLEMLILYNYKYRQLSKLKFNVLMMIVSLLLINLHGAMWIFTFILMLTYIVPDITELFKIISWKNTILSYYKAIIGMIVIAVLNPNGVDALTYTLKSSQMVNTQIVGEMLSPQLNTIYGIFVIFTIVLYVYAEINKRINGCLRWLSLGVIILACANLRSQWFLVLVIIPILSGIIENFVNDTELKKSSIFVNVLIRVSYSITLIVITVLLVGKVNENRDFLESKKPTQECDYLDTIDNKDNITVFTDYDFGGYVQYRGYKTYIDARAEAYIPQINNSEDILLEYGTISGVNGIGLEAIVDKYNFTHILCTDKSTWYYYLTYDNKYEAVVQSDDFLLFERKDFNGKFRESN